MNREALGAGGGILRQWQTTELWLPIDYLVHAYSGGSYAHCGRVPRFHNALSNGARSCAPCGRANHPRRNHGIDTNRVPRAKWYTVCHKTISQRQDIAF